MERGGLQKSGVPGLGREEVGIRNFWGGSETSETRENCFPNLSLWLHLLRSAVYPLTAREAG